MAEIPNLFLVATWAPPGRNYKTELLRAIALPVGMRCQFTYRRKWVADSARGELKTAVGREGLLVYCDPSGVEHGQFTAYPVRWLKDIRMDEGYDFASPPEEPSQRVQWEDEKIGISFVAADLFQYRFGEDVGGIRGEALVKGGLHAIDKPTNLRTPEEEDARIPWLDGKFVQWAFSSPAEKGGFEEPSWRRMVEALTKTDRLKGVSVFHVAGLERLPGSPRQFDGQGCTLNSTEAYKIEIHTYGPAAEGHTFEVASTSPSVSVANPIYRLVGSHKRAEILIQVARTFEKTVGTIRIGFSPPNDAPEVAFAVRVSPKRGHAALLGLGVGLGAAAVNGAIGELVDAIRACLTNSDNLATTWGASSNFVFAVLFGFLTFLTLRESK